MYLSSEESSSWNGARVSVAMIAEVIVGRLLVVRWRYDRSRKRRLIALKDQTRVTSRWGAKSHDFKTVSDPAYAALGAASLVLQMRQMPSDSAQSRALSIFA